MANGLGGLGAFAGGLAQGLRAGQEMSLRQQYVNRKAKADERDAESHQAKMEEINFNKGKRDRLRAANDEIVASWRDIGQQTGQGGRQVQSAQPVLGLMGISAESRPVVDTRVAGLSSLGQPPAQPTTSSDEMIGKRMLTGNLLEKPDELTRMATIYKKYGLLEEMAPWMNQVYAAKKKRIPDALHFLLTGNAKGAREILREGGMSLVDDPLQIKPNDQQQNIWKFRFEDGREEDINLKEFAAKFFPSPTLPSVDQALP
ncbi:hypothetical protein [Nitrosovibrio sp. Nv6]|uniref:hypothetical protein n=1 Tax=Nitrosovibrio sp. Nv6 TaxID=1855340 RepID=UPI0008B62247|nr:hypothetical protein [Nitrosovibrio sp. Nv6]SEO52338.1 hypothetical protein SAMN05216316_0408 [Nitrosovibrio sp. Nv6]